MARQVIALLFTDIVDSTALFQGLGPDQADVVRRDHDRAVTHSIEAAGGTVVKHLGDGLMATFPGPSAACDAAIAAQQAVTRSAARQNVDLSIRAGISLGEATHEDGDWFGQPVIEAARLCAAAQPGEILIADRAAAMGNIAGGVDPVGPLTLKGLDQPLATSRITWSTGAEIETPLPAGVRPNTRLPFVGREAPLCALNDRLKAAVAGEGGMVLVVGEPGIGKSRLVAEFAASAHAQGNTVAYGRCDQDSLFPYQPFAEAVRHLHTHAVVPSSVGIELLLPGSGEPPNSMDPDRARGLLLDATRDALRDAARERPLVLVLDDLHWADAGTLALLRHVLRDLGDAPLLVVGTYRDTDVGRTHPFGAFLAELARSQTERVHLSGIDDADIYALLVEIAQHELGPQAQDLAHLLASETSGNPFFLGEVLAHLAESGALAQDDGRWVATVDFSTMGLPEGVRDVVGQRLSRLSPHANEMLAVIAVNGRPIDLPLLASVWDGSLDDVVAAIDEAVAAGILLEETEKRSPVYWFSHALIRQTLLDELTGARIMRIHARLAERLAHQADHVPAQWIEAIHHCIEGAPMLGFDRAAEMLAASESALDQLAAPQTLVTVAERFDAMGRELGAAACVPWTMALVRASMAAFLTSDRERAGTLARRAIDLARQVDEPRAFVGAVSALAGSTGFGLDPEFAVLLPEALEKSEVGTVERIHLLNQQLQAATYTGTIDVIGAAQVVVDEAEGTGLALNIVGAHSSAAYAGQVGLPAAQTLQHAERALTFEGSDAVSPQALHYARFSRTYPLIRLGRMGDARNNALQLRSEATQQGSWVLVAAAHQQLAMIDLFEGDLDAAQDHIAEVRRAAPNEPMFEAGSIVQDLWLAHRRGDYQTALELAPHLAILPYPELVLALNAWLAAQTGDLTTAAAAGAQLAAIDLASLPTSWVTPGLWMMTGQLAVHLQEPTLAAQVEPLLKRLAGEQVIFVCNFVAGAADTVLAELAQIGD